MTEYHGYREGEPLPSGGLAPEDPGWPDYWRRVTPDEKDEILETGRLPHWLEERIEKDIRSGVCFTLDLQLRPHMVTGIYWNRELNGIEADRNVLAESIIKHVTEEEMPLELDGNKYVIRKVE